MHSKKIMLLLITGLILVTSITEAAITVKQLDKLLPSDGKEEWGFGWSIALDGNTALIGAGDADSCSYGTCSDGVYVFIRTAEKWIEQTKLIPNDDYIGKGYGRYIALSGDTALVGVPNDDDNGDGSGSVYVFTRSADTWSQQDKLSPNDPVIWQAFGFAVAIDGNTALIGVPYDDEKDYDAGAAYVFTRTGDTWTQQAKLFAEDGTSYDEFGGAVALDGDTAVIGASNYRPEGFPGASGTAYVFTRTDSTWTQQDQLISNDLAFGDSFGSTVAIHGDNVVVGAPTKIESDEYDPFGSAYIFNRMGETWTQQAKLLPSGYAYYSLFGSAVAIYNDKVLVGAPAWRPESTSGEHYGASYVFIKAGSSWTQVERLLEPIGEAYNNFGKAVAIQDEKALVGATGGDNTEGIGTGATYVYLLKDVVEEPFPWEIFIPAITHGGRSK